MNLFQFVLTFALLVISRVITFPIEDQSNSTEQLFATDQDIVECNATRTGSTSQCACSVINRTFVLCCEPANSTNLCLDDEQADNFDAIQSVSIIYSPMTSLVITQDIWTRIGVKDISSLRQFRVSNTSLTELQVCKNKIISDIPSPDKIRSQQIRRLKRFVTSRKQDDSGNKLLTNENASNEIGRYSRVKSEELYFCEDFVRLNRFDVNGNQMRHLHSMNMPNLDRLFIGGKTLNWSAEIRSPNLNFIFGPNIRSGVANLLGWPDKILNKKSRRIKGILANRC